jgi:serine O-acetyltransferase
MESARHLPADQEETAIKGNAGRPIIEDELVIYAGAAILGRIVVG